jgi:uncharacterized protein YacL
MHIELVLRIVGGILAATASFQADIWLVLPGTAGPFQHWLIYVLCSASFGVAFLVTPYVTTKPFFALRRLLYHSTIPEVAAVGVGLLLGLLAGALSAFPLSFLPGYLGQVLPVLATAVFAYCGMVILLIHRQEILSFMGLRQRSDRESREQALAPLLLDTSAIIDGRVADVSRAGFLASSLLVPRFVLEEVQHVADSADALRRARGRRGLDVLARLQRESNGRVEITDVDVDNAFGVDAKLVRLASTLSCPILTADSNLERVAQLQGVTVLNIHELANAIKPVVLPGEELSVQIVQEGKDPGQGLAYLDDGTMVVVEEGRRHVNAVVTVVITRVLQTGSGRMIFAQLKGSRDGARE